MAIIKISNNLRSEARTHSFMKTMHDNFKIVGCCGYDGRNDNYLYRVIGGLAVNSEGYARKKQNLFIPMSVAATKSNIL